MTSLKKAVVVIERLSFLQDELSLKYKEHKLHDSLFSGRESSKGLSLECNEENTKNINVKLTKTHINTSGNKPSLVKKDDLITNDMKYKHKSEEKHVESYCNELESVVKLEGVDSSSTVSRPCSHSEVSECILSCWKAPTVYKRENKELSNLNQIVSNSFSRVSASIDRLSSTFKSEKSSMETCLDGGVKEVSR